MFFYMNSGKFENWVVSVAGRDSRRLKKRARPKCKKNCKYAMKYESLGLQRNALRVEIMPPQIRCGWDLKDGRIGGCPDDYNPCIHQNWQKHL